MFEKYPETLARSQLVLAAVAVTQFLVSLDLSVVNVGLPRIADGLGFDAVGSTWVIHAYALTRGFHGNNEPTECRRQRMVP